MKYQEALEYLHGLRRFGIQLGLERTVELLRRVGRPDRRAGKIIHVTGTSGKGSVAAMVEAVLRAAGFKVGLYTSPSVEEFTDRIQVDRENIPAAEFGRLVGRLASEAQAMEAAGLEHPTEFEILTVAAFLYFAECRVDWLVLEVGLGGRYDTTNAIDAPVISCITNVGLDHTDLLGNTHEQIAWEKAGIIKPATPCVTGTDHPGALEVVRRLAAENDAVLTEVGPRDWRVASFGPEGQVVDLLGSRGWYTGVRLSLLGRHQAANAAVALRVLELAGVGESAIRAGLAAVVWPARFEILQVRGRQILLDAAHNQAKCQALAEALDEYFPARRIWLVLGVLADKQVEEMIQPLVLRAVTVLAVTPESPRALPAERLQELCLRAGHRSVTSQQSIAAGLTEALSGATPADLVVVTGSFYTVGPARRGIRSKIGQE